MIKQYTDFYKSGGWILIGAVLVFVGIITWVILESILGGVTWIPFIIIIPGIYCFYRAIKSYGKGYKKMNKDSHHIDNSLHPANEMNETRRNYEPSASKNQQNPNQQISNRTCTVCGRMTETNQTNCQFCGSRL